MIGGFHALDESAPYETGYNLHDAKTADILWSGDNSMTLLLRASDAENNAIVGVIEVDRPLA